MLTSGAQDGSVCLWNTTKYQKYQTLVAHEAGGSGWVMALVLARPPDDQKGCMLLTASYDHTVGVWVSGEWSANYGHGSGGGWERKHALKGHADGVLGVTLSRSRRIAFSCSNDQTVRAVLELC